MKKQKENPREQLSAVNCECSLIENRLKRCVLSDQKGLKTGEKQLAYRFYSPKIKHLKARKRGNWQIIVFVC